ATVVGDAVHLQQVLLTLVRKAAEAMTERVADAQVVVRTSATPAEHITVSIEDVGPAIDDVSVERMFVPFYTTKPDGLGMGLAISRSIIEAHGGRLWADRRPEGGLVVNFSLPTQAPV